MQNTLRSGQSDVTDTVGLGLSVRVGVGVGVNVGLELMTRSKFALMRDPFVTPTPLTESLTYPLAAAVSVYTSGITVSVYRPEASVSPLYRNDMVVDWAETNAPEMGSVLVISRTTPVMMPLPDGTAATAAATLSQPAP